MHYVTCSLLNSWIYHISQPEGTPRKEKSYQDLVDFINKIPCEPNQYMQKGLEFEAEVEKLSSMETIIPLDEHHSLEGKTAKILKGKAFQVNLHKEFPYKNPLFPQIDNIMLAGRTDAEDEDTIYDMKYCFRECFAGEYNDSMQHVIYLYCKPQEKFVYLMCHEDKDFDYFVVNEDVYYKKDIDFEKILYEKITEFLMWLHEHDLLYAYLSHWNWRHKS